MKGVIYNAVEDAVTKLYSADTWDDLLEDAGLSGEYTSLGNYDDTDLAALVGAACKATGHQPEVLVKVVGEHAFPYLFERHPELVAERSTFAFLRAVNDIIHPEVLKLYPDSNPPEFEFEDRSDGALRMTYRSARKLGTLAEGLIRGAAKQFGEEVDVEVISGAGDEETVFDIRVGATEADLEAQLNARSSSTSKTGSDSELDAHAQTSA